MEEPGRLQSMWLQRVGHNCVTSLSRQVLVPNFSGSVPSELCWWLGEHCAWGTSGPTTCIPVDEEGPRSVPTRLHFVNVHISDWQHQRMHVLEFSVALLPVEVLYPTYLTLQFRNGPGGFYSNKWGADSAPDSAVTTTEQRRDPVQHPVAGSGPRNTDDIPYQGITANTHWGKL